MSEGLPNGAYILSKSVDILEEALKSGPNRQRLGSAAAVQNSNKWEVHVVFSLSYQGISLRRQTVASGAGPREQNKHRLEF